MRHGVYYQNKIFLSVDETLNPETAQARGYIWYMDHIYDNEWPCENEEMEYLLKKDFTELVTAGWRIGAPANPRPVDAVGLYRPLNDNA